MFELTKEQIIKMLQEDNKPMDTEVEIYLECTNNDSGIWGKITDLSYDKKSKLLYFNGEYEEDNY